MEATAYFDKFADEQFAKDSAGALGGLLAAELIATGIGGMTVPGIGYTIPRNSGIDQAVGGASVIVGSEAAPIKGRMKRHAQVGGAIAIGHGIAERFGVVDQLNTAVAGAAGGN
ncbi:hypothetical protein BRC71_06315 [Halobacteriales archaeon QH_7_65_31]|nr:MAG: hypothetical protein BRC71_06315 [Halobacteriales archaeon QH_7_65_31]